MTAFIRSIETALPPYVATQQQIADFMIERLPLTEPEERKLRVLYRASGIQQRYSVLEDFSNNLNGKSFFKGEAFPTAKPRMLIYQDHAMRLAKEAARKVIRSSEMSPSDITHLIAVSCTGMYAPGLDIELVQALGLATSTQRTSINFMGCYAAFNALKVAQNIILSQPKATVLVVCVELCSIHLQDKTDEDSLLSNAIFGDGAAAMILSDQPSHKSLELKTFYNDLSLQAGQEMGWYIGDHGFEMKLSPKVPEAIRQGIGELTDHLLARIKMQVSDIDFFAIHPGGRRILEVIEEKLGISPERNAPSRRVLRDYGNMSSPTVLFVLKSILDTAKITDHHKHILSFAFGPGLTLESSVYKMHIHA